MYDSKEAPPVRGLDPDCLAWRSMGSQGGRLSLPESGVQLTVPEGALPRGHKETIYIAVLRDDRHRPKLTGKNASFAETILSFFPFLLPEYLCYLSYYILLEHG